MDNMNQGQLGGDGSGAGRGTRFPGWPAPPYEPPCPTTSQANFPNWPSPRDADGRSRPSSQIQLTGGSLPSFAWQPAAMSNPPYYPSYPSYPISQMPGYWYGQ